MAVAPDMVNIFWFRRDLRLNDNCGLYRALRQGLPVVGVFIFDENILSELRAGGQTVDERLRFIHKALTEMNEVLEEHESALQVYHGTPEDVWKKIMGDFNVSAVYTNRDYEPYATERDKRISKLLAAADVEFHSYKDQVIFEQEEVVKDDGTPYVVFTPYSRKWKEHLSPGDVKPFATEEHFSAWHELPAKPLMPLKEIGFAGGPPDAPEPQLGEEFLADYGETRDYPAIEGTSRIGAHLRFGTISIRAAVRRALEASADTYLNELIWREFYMMILWHFPHVVDRAFKPAYDHIPWRDSAEDFERWCEGKTGYPLVDAGMRQLKATGYMHNRVRMVTASFLTKHLLIDWRKGEAWFARHLLDYELASNNGGWQWAAGSGCDAAPYFRIFNPESQLKKFDKEGKYVAKWVPEWKTEDYPEPMVDHKFARERALEEYKKALDNAKG